MSQQIFVSGIGSTSHEDTLRSALMRSRPGVVGIAAAFVSVSGVDSAIAILQRCGQPSCRLIAGTDNAITHPEALYAARNAGWSLRLGRAMAGIFHPKVIIAGDKFAGNGAVEQLSCVYVGSSNLTSGGLSRNVECGVLADGADCLLTASTAFAMLWNTALPADDAALRNYAARFAELARHRTVPDLVDLGINDGRAASSDATTLRGQRPPRRAAVSAEFAVAAWTGLQSFTGEYRFQIEFPRSAGIVVSRLIGRRSSVRGGIEVYCPDDESTRNMKYRFYADNSMFRLNVPNDVTGVPWARENKDGIAIVEHGPPGGAPLRLRLLRPGDEAREIVSRSETLGTWGSTSTRVYGWY